MNFVAGITLYNPTLEQLKRANDLASNFEKVFLFNNSEGGYHLPNFLFKNNIEVIEGNGNRGLPYAYNEIIKRCWEYDYLCTLDQDSTFKDDDIISIKNKIEHLEENSALAIIAPYIDYGYGNHIKCDKFDFKRWVITSGSFINLKVLRRENVYYDESYFIDKFEIDLCEQLISKGYKVVMYHGATLYQQLGEDSGHHHPNHNLIRHYYLYRNRFYFNNKWYSGLYKCFLNVAQTFRHMMMIVLYENSKTKKLMIFGKSLTDYKCGNMGKLNTK